MNDLLAHRGPDGEGTWVRSDGRVGLAHRRLAIMDPANGQQPMRDHAGDVVTFNGEVYNHPEIRQLLGLSRWETHCDTETLLAAWRLRGSKALDLLRGMFAFAVWDEQEGEVVLARDRLGIKPLLYARVGKFVYFASEAKALLPFLPTIETDRDALRDYLTFQFCLPGRTMFRGVREVPPGHLLRIRNGTVQLERWWDVRYDLDWSHTPRWFEERVEALLHESVRLHLRSDVPVAAHLSGGVDSSAVASAASHYATGTLKAFTGYFPANPAFDETVYARAVADTRGIDLEDVPVGASDLMNLEQIIYHLDQPVAGPGAVPQFAVARAVSAHAKVALGGQGGDEVFGGYARYLAAYFEACIKAAIDGTVDHGQFVVTYESIIPSLKTLRGYEPLLQHLWGTGLFGDASDRYARLVDRSGDLEGIVRDDPRGTGAQRVREEFRAIFTGDQVGHESYFDKMTHFDAKTLLPALLHVEDRVSMAHGVETRVPLLDHELVEFAATIPADVKFKDGALKHVLRRATRALVPAQVQQRTDKMGFPVPLGQWLKGPAREWAEDVLSTDAARGRDFVDNRRGLERLGSGVAFGRGPWALLSLELWQRQFHDREAHFKGLLEGVRT